MRLTLTLLAALSAANAVSAQRDDKNFGPPLENVIIGGTSRFGRPTGLAGVFARSRLKNGADWDDVWTRTGTVPDAIPELPRGPLFVSFPSGIQIRPNDSVTSGLILQVPDFEFESDDPSALHTLIMVDVDIPPGLGGSNFLHYVVTNIPGNRVSEGDVITPYIPSFTFDFDPATGKIIKDSPLSHRYLWLVYR